jgi:hypothetical protein
MMGDNEPGVSIKVLATSIWCMGAVATFAPNFWAGALGIAPLAVALFIDWNWRVSLKASGR